MRPFGLRDFALTGGLFLLLCALVVHFENRATYEIAGAARVIDGDSLEIGGLRIRLAGIDAPELGQTCNEGTASYACGEQARTALDRLVAGQAVACVTRRKDRYDRFMSTCAAGDRDLNRAMVEAGWAVASGDYHLAEARARRDRRGLWSGTFEDPREWRMRQGMAGDGGIFDMLFDRVRLLLHRS